MVNQRQGLVALALISAFLSGCQTTAQHVEQVQSARADALTVGKVQREIKLGMSGSEVATVLGSPNIVSTDEERREVWIYDKIATDRAFSSSSGGVNTLILGGGGSVGGRSWCGRRWLGRSCYVEPANLDGYY